MLKVSLAGAILLFLLFFSVYLGFLGKVPSREELVRVKTPLASEVFSADGKLLGRYYTENRSYVSYQEISQSAEKAPTRVSMALDRMHTALARKSSTSRKSSSERKATQRPSGETDSERLFLLFVGRLTPAR